mmetsp:Transcript_4874/g.11557  ORF Transcript_4874/g.11557 Transcript_4874/m.11557 type:complete len:206 (+) Transcript_4874:1499-2116(+)
MTSLLATSTWQRDAPWPSSRMLQTRNWTGHRLTAGISMWEGTAPSTRKGPMSSDCPQGPRARTRDPMLVWLPWSLRSCLQHQVKRNLPTNTGRRKQMQMTNCCVTSTRMAQSQQWCVQSRRNNRPLQHTSDFRLPLHVAYNLYSHLSSSALFIDRPRGKSLASVYPYPRIQILSKSPSAGDDGSFSPVSDLSSSAILFLMLVTSS